MTSSKRRVRNNMSIRLLRGGEREGDEKFWFSRLKPEGVSGEEKGIIKEKLLGLRLGEGEERLAKRISRASLRGILRSAARICTFF